jgi:polyisoprenoid-binding protein YceI
METIKWKLDPSHSEIEFKVRHMVSYVTGSFTKFDATVETQGQDITTAKVRFTADLASITTNNEQRDRHLKSGDFFDVERYPQIIFEGTHLDKMDEEEYTLYGNLTMRGVTKPVILKVNYGGMIEDPWGNTRVGFTVTGKIKRKDWGVSFDVVSETGNLLLSNDVSLNCDVQFTMVPVEQEAHA